MKKTILEIYALAVCFATIVCAVCTLGIALWSVVELAKPDFTIDSYTYERHQDLDSFQKACPVMEKAVDTNKAVAYAEVRSSECGKLTEAELIAKRDKSWAQELKQEQRSALQTIVRCLIVLLLNSLVFFVHWVLARRARQTTA